MSDERSKWYVWDYETGTKLRGPYSSATEAGAVRTEMERDPKWAERNLWIISEASLGT